MHLSNSAQPLQFKGIYVLSQAATADYKATELVQRQEAPPQHPPRQHLYLQQTVPVKHFPNGNRKNWLYAPLSGGRSLVVTNTETSDWQNFLKFEEGYIKNLIDTSGRCQPATETEIADSFLLEAELGGETTIHYLA